MRLLDADRRRVAVTAGKLLFVALTLEVGLRVNRPAATAKLLGIKLIEASQTPRRVSGLSDGSSNVELQQAIRLALRSVRAVYRRTPLPSTCLRRSMLTAFALRKLDPVVEIGVKLSEGDFEAHAWVRIGDLVMDPPGVSDSFAPLHR